MWYYKYDLHNTFLNIFTTTAKWDEKSGYILLLRKLAQTWKLINLFSWQIAFSLPHNLKIYVAVLGSRSPRLLLGRLTRQPPDGKSWSGNHNDLAYQNEAFSVNHQTAVTCLSLLDTGCDDFWIVRWHMIMHYVKLTNKRSPWDSRYPQSHKEKWIQYIRVWQYLHQWSKNVR